MKALGTKAASILSALLCFIISTSASSLIAATTLYFDAEGGTKTWDYNTGNWSATSGLPYDQIWVDGSVAYFEGTGGTVNVSGTISSVSSIKFDVSGYTLTGGTIGLSGTGGNITTSGGNTIITSELSGSEGLTKRGSGSLTLSGINTYTGGTNIIDDALHITTPGALPEWNVPDKIMIYLDSTLIVSVGGTNEWNAVQVSSLIANANFYDPSELVRPRFGFDTTNADGGVFTYDYSIDGNLGVTKYGAETLVLAAENNYYGDTTINDGILCLGNPGAIKNSTLDYVSGTLSFGVLNNATVGGLSGNHNLTLRNQNSVAVALTIGNNDTSTEYNGNLDGSGSLTKIGKGTLLLSGANTYTGGTIVRDGVLQAATTAALSEYTTTGKIAVESEGTLAINIGGLGEWTETNVNTLLANVDFAIGSAVGFDTTNADSAGITFSSTLDGAHGLTKLGKGVLILTGANNYTGKTTITEGTLQFGDGVVSNGIGDGGIGDIDNNYILIFNNPNDLTYSGVISGTGVLKKSSTGVLTLSGDNTFSGSTVLVQREMETSLGGLGSLRC